jgi:hypothetical protein
MDEIASGLVLERTARTAWTDLRRITSKRAYFFASPSSDQKTTTYVIRNDIVGILSRKDDWLRVEYPGVKKMVGGWIHLQDTDELSPPE